MCSIPPITVATAIIEPATAAAICAAVRLVGGVDDEDDKVDIGVE